MLAKEAEVVFTFATATPEEKAMMSQRHFCLYSGGEQISLNSLIFPVFYSIKIK